MREIETWAAPDHRRTSFKSEGNSALPPLELLRREIETETTENISVRNIVLEAGLVDESHVNNLAESMKGPRGQISPLTVRARLSLDGRGKEVIHYDIIDGFHRAYALVQIGKDTTHAVVVYGCSDEELFDLRVLAANSVRSVQFARVAKWMEYSFAQTAWAKKGLKLSQVCSLVVASSSGRNLGLTEPEAKEAKQWVVDKSKIWNRPVTAILETMRAVEVADPGLIAQVRIGGGGHENKGVLNPTKFKAVVSALPNDYKLQKRIINVVIGRNLKADETKALAEAIAKTDDPDRVNSLLRNPYSVSIASTKVTQPHVQSTPVRVQPPKLQPISEPPESKLDPEKTQPKVTVLEEKPVITETAQNGSWWRELGGLNPTTKRILELFFDQNTSLHIIATTVGLSPQRVIEHFEEAFRVFISRLKAEAYKNNSR